MIIHDDDEVYQVGKAILIIYPEIYAGEYGIEVRKMKNKWIKKWLKSFKKGEIR